MPKPSAALQCPHCGQRLTAMALPDDVQWEEACHFVCFNDECSYYREGWEWMMEQFGARTSYRYRVVDPERGTSAPLAVWSETAHRDRIIEDDGG